MKQPTTIPIKALIEEPFASVLSYPRANALEIEQRIEELTQLGVEAIEFGGKTSAANVPVLGKGYVGVVVAAVACRQKVALKIRRIDADRPDFNHEAKMLRKANQIDIGPKFIAVSNNFLVSQLIDGDLLEDWLTTQKDKEQVSKVLLDILEQCWRLDEVGLDHGELSKAPKHLLVDKAEKPFIVDFETASVTRKVINVTSVCQFLFLGNSQAAKMLNEMLGKRNRSELIFALKSYKKNMTRVNFEGLLEVCFS